MESALSRDPSSSQVSWKSVQLLFSVPAERWTSQLTNGHIYLCLNVLNVVLEAVEYRRWWSSTILAVFWLYPHGWMHLLYITLDSVILNECNSIWCYTLVTQSIIILCGRDNVSSFLLVWEGFTDFLPHSLTNHLTFPWKLQLCT